MPRLGLLSATRLAAMTGALGCVFAALAGAASCSFLIADAPPSFTCLPDQKDVCPTGQLCAPVGTTHKCMAPCVPAGCPGGYQCDREARWCVPVIDSAAVEADTSNDGSTSDATVDATVDAYVDADANVGATADSRVNADAIAEADAIVEAEAGVGYADGCAGGAIGCECNTPGTTAACEVGAFCAEWLAITGGISTDGDAGDAESGDSGGRRVCTKACCTSNDCYKGSVCFGTGAGGNYCVPPSALTDRVATGTLNANGGQPCDASGSCRSGICSPLSAFCVDTCCTSGGRPGQNQCAAGNSCRVGAFQGSGSDTNYVPRCAPQMGMASNGDMCASNSECRSNLCVNDPVSQSFTCRDPCRRPEDCGGMPPQTCQYLQLGGSGTNPNNDLVAACGPLSPSGPGVGGALDSHPCKTSSDCARGYCAPVGAGQSVCIAVCFVDGDCISNETCRPQTLQVMGTTYSVLACK